ncbi:PH domain-containing protein [Propioniciclava sp. MC1595]|mgnify:CR=1 FL=1|uniref:PH domain-containing protein n=1 Tax=unclassified Propioniciclava TaxID=2642922 RepID=UPI0015FF5958|nr:MULTISPECIES: PH domain-containing protein [unclassified Propioniciclava]MBB1496297.1 PH domain-containing protein [Propioniciclava sp. MC1595]MBB1502676.1 PH domain-containing protein [Propioniciclava sp. MC1683]NLE16983.1 PH domain-containing protein [Propioniciclava sp.]QTE24869.1 PH domain-containing protein [Propioniciclava sp. MC1595]
MADNTSTWEFTAHPHMLRRQAAIWTIVMGGAAVFGWFMLPQNIRVLFNGFQIATLIFFVAVMLGIVWAAALGYVKAGPQGMKFRNMAVTHEIPWSEIASVRFGPADHWAFVELADTSDRPVLGIMRSDGRLAQEQFDGLAAVAAKYLAR